MLGWWTIGRAEALGVAAGLAALSLWPFQGEHGPALDLAFGAAACVTGICGASILLVTLVDMIRRRRGARIRPLRGFDLFLAAALILLCAAALESLWGASRYTP